MDREEFVDVSPKEELVELITDEMSTVKNRMQEIKDHIDGMRVSVDKEKDRFASIASEINNIKDNLATVPREDIRDKYDEAINSRFRLATMSGQIEKFEANYQSLEEHQQFLGRILANLQGHDFLPDEDDGGGFGPKAFDIVGIIRAGEEERQRLARAMHDGPAQSLTNFILQTEICQRLFDRDPERASVELNTLKTDASRTFQKVRDFIFDLRPMMLDDLGVVPTVRRYVEMYGDKNDIETSLEITGEERRLENYREVLIFRGIQDLMALSRDHANPTEVEVRLDLSGDTINVTVEDNGSGFDTSALDDGEDAHDDNYTSPRVQILTMLRSKVEMVDGTLQVRSSENDGTVVQFELPAE